MDRFSSEMVDLSRHEETKRNDYAHPEEKFEKSKYLAQICLRFEQYEDAIQYVDELIKIKENELTEEERDLFVSAYRIYINEKRTAWRSIFIAESTEKEQKSKYTPLLNEIRISYEETIQNVCEKLIYCINTYIIKKT